MTLLSKNTFKFILFDFNGTLFLDNKVQYYIINQHRKMNKKKLLSSKFIKKTYNYPHNYHTFTSTDIHLKLYHEGVELYDPQLCVSLDILKKLRKYVKIGIVSNFPLDLILKHTDATYFDTIVGKIPYLVSNKIDIINQVVENIMKKHNLQRHEIVYIGDTLLDKQTADSANIPCILVSSGMNSYKRLKQCNVPIYKNCNIMIENLIDPER